MTTQRRRNCGIACIVLALLCPALAESEFDAFRQRERRAFDAFRRAHPERQAPPAPTAPSDLAPAESAEASATDSRTTDYTTTHFLIRYDSETATEEQASDLGEHLESAFSTLVNTLGLRDPRGACVLEAGRIVVHVDPTATAIGQRQFNAGQWDGRFWLTDFNQPDLLIRYRAINWVLFAIQNTYADLPATRNWLGTALRESLALSLIPPKDAHMILAASPLTPRFFSLPIHDKRHHPDGILEHLSTHFIRHLFPALHREAKDLLTSGMADESRSAFTALQAILNATGRSLDTRYRDFARDFFLQAVGDTIPEGIRQAVLRPESDRLRTTFELNPDCTAAAWHARLHRKPDVELAPWLTFRTDDPLPAGVTIDIFDASASEGAEALATILPGRDGTLIDFDNVAAVLLLVRNTGEDMHTVTVTAARFTIRFTAARQIVADLPPDTTESEFTFEADVAPAGQYRVEWELGEATYEDDLAPDKPTVQMAHLFTELESGQDFYPQVRLFDADSNRLLAHDRITLTIGIRSDGADHECGVEFDWSMAEKVDVNFQTYHRIWDESDGSPGRPVRHGPYRGYFDKDKQFIQSRGCYREGRQVGRWSTWHRNGNRNSEIIYVEGVVTGPVERWWENGNPRTKGTLIEKRDDSIWEVERGINQWDGRVQTWYEDGHPQRETHYASGTKQGWHRTWYPGGQPEFEIVYHGGRKHGVERHWNEGGEILHELHYQDDRLHGPQSVWTRAFGRAEEPASAQFETGEQRTVWIWRTSDGRVLWRRNQPTTVVGTSWIDATETPPPSDLQ